MTWTIGIRKIIELFPRIIRVVDAIKLSCRDMGMLLRVIFTGNFRGQMQIGIGTVIEHAWHGGDVHVVGIILRRHMMKQRWIGLV